MQQEAGLFLFIRGMYQGCQSECVDYKQQINQQYWQGLVLLLEDLGIRKTELYSLRSTMTPQTIELILKQYSLMQRGNHFKLLKSLKKEQADRIKLTLEQTWSACFSDDRPIKLWYDFYCRSVLIVASLAQTFAVHYSLDDIKDKILCNVTLFMLAFDKMRSLASLLQDKIEFIKDAMEESLMLQGAQAILIQRHQQRLAACIDFRKQESVHGPCTHVMPLNESVINTSQIVLNF